MICTVKEFAARNAAPIGLAGAAQLQAAVNVNSNCGEYTYIAFVLNLKSSFKSQQFGARVNSRLTSVNKCIRSM
jgi:hypothetical protein